MKLKTIRTFNVTFVHDNFIITTTITNNDLSSINDDTDITTSQDAYEGLVYHASMTIQDNMPLAVQLGDMKTFLVKWASDITIEEVNQ
jgi:hypothetical protein